MKLLVASYFFFACLGHAGSAEPDPRLKALNQQLLELGLDHFHQARVIGERTRETIDSPIDPGTHGIFPFHVRGETLGSKNKWLEIEPLGLQAVDKNISFQIKLSINPSEEFSFSGVSSGKNKVLEANLDNLIDDPLAMIFVSFNFEFDSDWTRTGSGYRNILAAPNTKAQVLGLLRADLALGRLRQELTCPNIFMKTNIVIGSRHASGGDSESFGVGPSIGFHLDLPKGVSVFKAYVLFYRFLFEGLLKPQIPELPSPLTPIRQVKERAASMISRLRTGKRDTCTLLLESGTAKPLQLSGPSSRELTVVKNKKSWLSPRATIVTLKNPLGSVDFLVSPERR